MIQLILVYTNFKPQDRSEESQSNITVLYGKLLFSTMLAFLDETAIGLNQD